jgi:hypothetical protein
MTSRIRHGGAWLLILAAGMSLALAAPAGAQAVPVEDAAAEATEPALDINDVDMKDVEDKDLVGKDLDGKDLDWSQLTIDASTLTTAAASKGRAVLKAGADGEIFWSSKDKPNGSADVSVKQPLSPFWDARIGADMTVVHQPQTLTSADLLRQRFSPDAQPSQSSGTAWAAITAPGVGSIWDKTAIEARVDPSQEQSKLGTSLSKTLPLSEQYSLTLQNAYNVIQHGIMAVPGAASTRNYEVDRSAKLSMTDTGTSLIAGQSLSSADDKWLRKVGAEQKLFDGVTITGTIGETAFGPANKSLTAGFKRSW